MRQVNWQQALEDLPTQCSRKHETVEMINYGRSGGKEGGGTMKFFCPSCHQKIELRIKKISGGCYAATSYKVLEKGDI